MQTTKSTVGVYLNRRKDIRAPLSCSSYWQICQ